MTRSRSRRGPPCADRGNAGTPTGCSADPLPDRVLHALRTACLCAPGDLVLAAVSGGLDSTVLLHVLASLRTRGGPRIEAAHLDHMLRGAASGGDAAFVEEQCRRLAVPLHRARANVRLRAARRGTGVEEEGRKARHAFWREICRRRHAAAVATGHHADDQVETVLFRLARGTGPRGLAGMRPCTEIEGLRMIRPLLDIERRELEAYASRQGLAWREDASNRLLEPARNRLRHVVLPAFEAAFGSGIRRSIRRSAEVIAAEDAWIEEEAARRMMLVRDGPALRIDPLAETPDPIRLRIVRRWVLERTGLILDRAASLRLAALAGKGRDTATLVLGRNLRVARAYGLIRLYRHPLPVPVAIPVTLPGGAFVPETGVRLACRPIGRAAWSRMRACGRLGGFTESVDLDRTGPSGILRVCAPGDALRPLGMRGRRKVHDIFTDARIPRQQRRLWPILECRGRIVWLVGLRLDHAFRVRHDTARIGLLTAVNTPVPWI